MNEIPSSAPSPAGWYPDPEGSGNLRYWDGAAWQQQVMDPGGSAAQPVGPGFDRLSRVVGAGLAFVALVSVAHAGVNLWGLSMFDGAIEAGDIDRLSSFDTLDAGLTIAVLISYVVTGIAWVFWQYRLARSVPEDQLRRGPGMHAGSWFIPFANLVMPFQNVKDLWVKLLPGRGTTLLGWWWAAWIISNIIDRFVANTDPAADVDGLKSAVTTGLVGDLVTLAAAVLALSIVRALTAAALHTADHAKLAPSR